MTRPMIKIHNAETNEVIEREMTKQEHDLYLITIAGYQKEKAETEAREAAKVSALEKLAVLGLTETEIAAL